MDMNAAPAVDHEILVLGKELYSYGKKVEVPTWQALDVRNKPQGTTVELTNQPFCLQIPNSQEHLTDVCKPSIPWAEKQFQERVGGKPVNPGDTYQDWPYYTGNVEQHKEQGRFSHTYAERYWPSDANPLGADGIRRGYPSNKSQFGDLNDIVKLLARESTTRQAYLPVFFPFDTGAVHGERIPCSLGYLFLMREGKLNITYYIRSCDFYRHFRDDVYMTARLCQWVLARLQEPTIAEVQAAQFGGLHRSGWDWDTITPGRLTMHIGSLHVFEGDLPKLRREYG